MVETQNYLSSQEWEFPNVWNRKQQGKEQVETFANQMLTEELQKLHQAQREELTYKQRIIAIKKWRRRANHAVNGLVMSPNNGAIIKVQEEEITSIDEFGEIGRKKLPTVSEIITNPSNWEETLTFSAQTEEKQR
jgi:hypothetical protein